MNQSTLLISVVSVLLLSGCITLDTAPGETAHIDRVIDGDTLETADGETVRLLGINTAEKGERYSTAARERLEELVLNQNVTLEQGTADQDKDQYGRSLRYVRAEDVLVNRVLVEEGLATTYLLDDDDRYRKTLLRAEQDARQNGRGLWAPSSVTGCITITGFAWDPDGNDNYRLNEEYVTFQNTCSHDLQMNGWTVKDAGTNTYTFSSYTLSSSESVRLHTGRGQDNATDRYWKQGQAVWNNDGDALYLRDESGLLVTFDAYSGR